MRSKSYRININPIAWQRPARNGNRYYDSQAKDKVSFGLYLNHQHNNEAPFDKAIHMEVIFYMPIPKSIKDRKESIYHATTPDLDNLCKFLLDAIKDVLITDDRIICSLTAKKVYDKDPRTELIITEVVERV